MIPVAEALERLFALVRPVGTETVALARAGGRVLAADAVARRTQPPFPASAMDGYAVRAAEAALGATLPVVGEAAAGRRHPGPLPPGAAVRIFTGAPVPDGADAILIQEDARRDGDRIIVAEAPAPGAHIRPAGCDFAAGERLAAPRRLAARDVALLAAMNLPEVTVSRRPRVALIATGDELVEPGEEPGPDQIVTSNNYGLAAMLAAIGAEPVLCPIARDSRDSLLAALEPARGADFVVTLGGASVGDHDLVAGVFDKAGLTLEFYRIAMRPGKPLMAGRMGDAVMLGLPGNPVSAMVCGEVFLRPAVEAAQGLPPSPRATRPGRLAHALPKNGPREHYMRAVVDAGEDRVRVFENQDSSLLATLARANALVVREPHAPELAAGAQVRFIPL
jgi:molybdopterin molybdotransferase